MLSPPVEPAPCGAGSMFLVLEDLLEADFWPGIMSAPVAIARKAFDTPTS